MNSGLIVPSGGFSLIIISGVSEVVSSFGSEVGSFSDFVIGFSEFGGVDSDSFVALFKGGLTDTHEVGMSGKLILLILMSIGQSFMALIKDILEHTEDSLDGSLVGEVLSDVEHDFDHFRPFGSVSEVFQELLDVVLGFSNLYE